MIAKKMALAKALEVDTLEELNTMLTALQKTRSTKSFLAQAVLAMAFGSGLRKGELQGLTWEHFKVQQDGSAKVTVAQSVWHGKVITPKTEASSDVVDLGENFVAYVEQYRKAIGGVDSGFMFGNSTTPCIVCKRLKRLHGRRETDHGFKPDQSSHQFEIPIDLDSLRKWVKLPMLKRCAICKRPETAHGEERAFHPSCETKHAFVRDKKMPTWKGWHAFRRGNATHLAKNFGNAQGVEAASRVLRHSDSAVTANHYVKESKQDRRARAAA